MLDKLDPYKVLMTSIAIEELVGSDWVQLICIPIIDPKNKTPEDIQEILEKVNDLFYKSDKVQLAAQGVYVCVRNLDKSSRTFRTVICSREPG